MSLDFQKILDFQSSVVSTVLYIPGFFAPMDLRKTVAIEEYAIQNGYSNVRYDQECVGKSTGSQTTIEFEHWLEDALGNLKF